MGNPLISGKSRLVKYYNLARIDFFGLRRTYKSSRRTVVCCFFWKDFVDFFELNDDPKEYQLLYHTSLHDVKKTNVQLDNPIKTE